MNGYTSSVKNYNYFLDVAWFSMLFQYILTHLFVHVSLVNIYENYRRERVINDGKKFITKFVLQIKLFVTKVNS